MKQHGFKQLFHSNDRGCPLFLLKWKRIFIPILGTLWDRHCRDVCTNFLRIQQQNVCIIIFFLTINFRMETQRCIQQTNDISTPQTLKQRKSTPHSHPKMLAITHPPQANIRTYLIHRRAVKHASIFFSPVNFTSIGSFYL